MKQYLFEIYEVIYTVGFIATMSILMWESGRENKELRDKEKLPKRPWWID